MVRQAASPRRERGNIRRRGNSYQVRVYAGVDPLTGQDHYLRRSGSNASGVASQQRE